MPSVGTSGYRESKIYYGGCIWLPVPIFPLAEQERIVAEVERRLSVVEELSSLVTANLQRATRLRQSIFQQAFEGKLVPTGAKH
jgi:type I restriction enzyme S subunit